jgi:hypothetical protein
MKLLTILLMLMLAITSAHAQQSRSTNFYDSRGHKTGSASTDSQGTTTFYDDRGNVTGRASRR